MPKELDLARRRAFDGLDRKVIEINAWFASRSGLLSSDRGQQVLDVLMSCYDQYLVGFDTTYIEKWRGRARSLSQAEYEWLKQSAISILEADAREVSAKCNGFLWERTLVFRAFWDEAGQEARRKNQEIFEKIEILRLEQNLAAQTPKPTPTGVACFGQSEEFWNLLHPIVAKIARTRFESGHFADCVEAALKEVNQAVRATVKARAGEELDGTQLMHKAFSAERPIIVLDDLASVCGKDIQKGYHLIFAGTMIGIRNPKAHANLEIDQIRAIHFLFLASLLMFKLDEQILPPVLAPAGE